MIQKRITETLKIGTGESEEGHRYSDDWDRRSEDQKIQKRITETLKIGTGDSGEAQIAGAGLAGQVLYIPGKQPGKQQEIVTAAGLENRG